MKKVVITGASGFIGNQCLPFLQERGYEIHALSRKPVLPQRQSKTRPAIIWHALDLLDATKTSALIETIQPTHLLHLAWVTTHGKYWYSTENLLWIQASLNLARAFAQCKGKRMVATGTCAEYADSSLSIEQTNSFASTTLYGTCKRALYLILAAYAKEVGMSFAWSYLFHLYGPQENEKRFLPSVILGLLKKEEVSCSHGLQKRDFLHVRDAAEALVTLLDSPLEGALNIASGEAISLRDFAQKIAKKIGGAHLLKFGARESSQDAPLLVADVTRMHTMLGFKPKYTLDQGLDEVITWWKENRLLQP